MLYRDVRRLQRRHAAQRAMKKEWLQTNELWSSCVNHGLTATSQHNENWVGINDLLLLHEVKFPYSATMNVLVCFGCRSIWRVTDDATHP